jgi:spore coat polysaccharide biosynthesis protein SpsF
MTARVDAAIVVQARMSSTRLPGKVLSPLAGEPAIVRMMQRLERVRCASYRVVATSRDSSDDPLAAACQRYGIPCVRGSLDDVLGRVVAATPRENGAVVRLTADCPLVDPALVDAHLERFAQEGPSAEYVTNAVVRTYPDGLDVEVVSRELLVEADRRATSAFDREHVTPWIQRHARTLFVTQPVDLSELRWVLDTSSDYESLSSIYAALYQDDPLFASRSVYELLVSRPELIRAVDGTSRTDLVGRMRELLALEAEA